MQRGHHDKNKQKPCGGRTMIFPNSFAHPTSINGKELLSSLTRRDFECLRTVTPLLSIVPDGTSSTALERFQVKCQRLAMLDLQHQTHVSTRHGSATRTNQRLVLTIRMSRRTFRASLPPKFPMTIQ